MLAAAPTYATRMAGRLKSARPLWLAQPPKSTARKTVAQKLGLSYESKVLKYLEDRIVNFIPHLVFEFNDEHGFHRAIPDAVFFTPDLRTICIVEIKLRHTVDGWYQLNKLYAPVVRMAFPAQRIKLLEITKVVDPAIKLPGPYELVSDLLEWVEELETCSFGIHSWRP